MFILLTFKMGKVREYFLNKCKSACELLVSRRVQSLPFFYYRLPKICWVKRFFFFKDAKNFLRSRTTERRLREQQVTSQGSTLGGVWNKRDMGSFSHNVQWLNYEYCTNTIWHAAPINQKIKEQWFIKTMEYCIKRYIWSLIAYFTRPPMSC